MAKFHPTLCALAVLSVSSALAQQTTTPGIPVTQLAPAAVPAPIEPPIQLPPSQQTVQPLIAEVSADAVPSAALPPLANGNAVSPTATRLSEFQGDEIGLVLRTLAKQAKVNIVVSDQVAQTAGPVNMRIEDRTPKEAIEIIVTAKGLIMDEQNGVYFIKTSAEKAKEPTESGNYTLAYAQAEKIAPLLQGQLQSGVAPQFDQRTNTLFYRENRSNLAQITLFLDSIDRPTQQVMIEARLVEVTSNPKQSYGINWAGVLGNQRINLGGSNLAQTLTNNSSRGVANGGLTGTNGGDGNGTVTLQANDGSSVPNFTGSGAGTLAGQGSSTGSSVGALERSINSVASAGEFLLQPANLFSTIGGQFAILSAPQLSLTLNLLNQDADAEFLANPRVVTANNQKATVKITRQQPVPQLNFNEQTAQAVFSGFQDKEFGNTLVVTPSINKDGYISMLVQPEISNKVGDATFTFGGATVTSPVIDKRTLDSNVLIHTGDTLAIGGLLQDEQSKARTKIPVLGDIPIFGYLFQERINARTKRNLLIFVTPTIIKQGYGTGLEDQVSGLTHTGEEFADPNGWRNNAKGAKRIVPTSNRSLAADYPKPGVAPAPKKAVYRTSTRRQ